MTDLRLSLGCGDYDRTEALRDGSVKPDGIELTYVTVPAGELFMREGRSDEFDVCEISLSSYVLSLSRGDDRYVAIPVFPSRVFRHRDSFVNAAVGVSSPADLKGRRIGVHFYAMSLAVWLRGILSDEFGVLAEDVTWVKAGVSRAGAVPNRWSYRKPERIRIEVVADRSIDEMLLAGDLDAAFLPAPPPSMLTSGGRIARLFPNVKQVQQEYFERTRIFPIMHVIGIRREIYERDPWVAQSLLKAFEEAKSRCYRRIANTGGTSYSILPFAQLELEETVRDFGEDFWPYGLNANRHVLETLTRYSYEQGISERLVGVDEMFPPTALEPLSKGAIDAVPTASVRDAKPGYFLD